MKKYIIILLILIIPNTGFSKITGITFNSDIGFIALGDAAGEKHDTGTPVVSVHALLNIDNHKGFNLIVGYNNYLKSPVMGFEAVSHDRLIFRMGQFLKGGFGQYGYLFENNISLTGSIYTGGPLNSGVKDTVSYLSLETGWRF